MTSVIFQINPPLDPNDVPDLREAVGWDRQKADYQRALLGYWATVGGFDDQRQLVAWCAILSDGVYHAVLLDVMVHPACQRRGIGRQLLQTALAHLRASGISIVHVDYLPDVQGFYERCGFRTGLGGILELDSGLATE